MRHPALILALTLLSPAGYAQRHDTPADQASFAALSKSIDAAPADQRLAYNSLLVAFITFRDAHLRHETCLTSQHCPERQTADRAALNHEFLAIAHGFAPNPAPSFADTDLTSADGFLNLDFDTISNMLPSTCPGADCLSKSTFQEVQRDWIRYRDAWITFAALRLPQISGATIRTYLTHQRVSQLLTRFPTVKASSPHPDLTP